MKWICGKCKAINPQFSYECHNCGAKHPAVGSKTPTELIKQGKYECGAAALALLLGHTLFNVKRVLGSFGWRNDFDGVTEEQLKLTAREFGRDLVWCPKSVIDVMPIIPDGIITLLSLNYIKKFHGVAYFNGEVIDSNFGDSKRKFWGADADMKCVDIYGISIITKEPLTDEITQEITHYKTSKCHRTMADLVLKLAG